MNGRAAHIGACQVVSASPSSCVHSLGNGHCRLWHRYTEQETEPQSGDQLESPLKTESTTQFLIHCLHAQVLE